MVVMVLYSEARRTREALSMMALPVLAVDYGDCGDCDTLEDEEHHGACKLEFLRNQSA
jgi:hypothetical protein